MGGSKKHGRRRGNEEKKSGGADISCNSPKKRIVERIMGTDQDSLRNLSSLRGCGTDAEFGGVREELGNQNPYSYKKKRKRHIARRGGNSFLFRCIRKSFPQKRYLGVNQSG